MLKLPPYSPELNPSEREYGSTLSKMSYLIVVMTVMRLLSMPLAWLGIICLNSHKEFGR
ncbi:hypothetical protein [Psychrobacter fulvigenes]|uniref:hypothetical protein n=1 Tax=Psychrobacter fulvigenes TaxID=533323 RepID=UPI001917B0CF|nr:hypothetical protein [Psychrobacter fulvigenes]